MLKVNPIKPQQTYSWLLNRHYAKRIPPISFAFGLYDGAEIVGVVTYGVPASSSLRDGVAGRTFSGDVIELNRLCISSGNKNAASLLVSGSIKSLPKNKIIVSYADTSMGHIGYVYQATNFIYTGLSEKRTDWKIKGLEHLHGATIADMSRGKKDRGAYMRERFGDDFYLQDRPRKHRYIYIYGTKKYKKKVKGLLSYKEKPYPKGSTKKYDDSGHVENQFNLF